MSLEMDRFLELDRSEQIQALKDDGCSEESVDSIADMKYFELSFYQYLDDNKKKGRTGIGLMMALPKMIQAAFLLNGITERDRVKEGMEIIWKALLNSVREFDIFVDGKE